MDDVNAALNNVDRVILNGLEECPCLLDLFNKLKEVDNNTILGNMFECIETSEGYTQTFQIKDIPGFHNTINHNEGSGNMLIPQSVCDGTTQLTDLEITSKFIHEFIHGYFAELLQYNFPNGDPGDWFITNPNDPTDLDFNYDYWLDLVQVYNNTANPPSNHQHLLFFTHLLDVIAESLAAIAGTGTPADYMYFAHQIINTKSIAEDFGFALNIPQNLEYSHTNEGQYFHDAFSRWTTIGGIDLINTTCNE